jgi:ABC-type antimicrobial peptide transport system permease subunit
MTERLDASLAPQRFRAALVGGFGALALVLSVVGVYGVVAHAVGRRTREIGIRMALGQDARRVRLAVVGGALRVALVGTALGALAAVGVGRWLSTFLVDVSPRDPALLGAVGALLLGAAAAAAYAPARRASRVDPALTLHGE